jgi:hypothetical protein
MFNRDIPASGAYMWVYQATLRMLKPKESNSSIPLFSTLFAGGLAGTFINFLVCIIHFYGNFFVNSMFLKTIFI